MKSNLNHHSTTRKSPENHNSTTRKSPLNHQKLTINHQKNLFFHVFDHISPVCRQDVDRPLEMIEAAHPTLGGGILLLDKAGKLYRNNSKSSWKNGPCFCGWYIWWFFWLIFWWWWFSGDFLTRIFKEHDQTNLVKWENVGQFLGFSGDFLIWYIWWTMP